MSLLFSVVLLVGSFAFAAAPQVTGTSPVTGAALTQVQISGGGFGAIQGSSTVTFNGAAASVTSWSDGQITATVPAAALTGPVVVMVAGTASNSSIYFNVPATVVSSVVPANGSVGTQVTVTGSGFRAAKGGSTITFNNIVAAVSSWSDTQIVATVPANAVTGPVKVTVNGAASNQDIVFTMPNPIVTSLAPTSGPVNTQVLVNGSGFGATRAVAP